MILLTQEENSYHVVSPSVLMIRIKTMSIVRNKISSKGIELYKKAKSLIPGGTQLLSKRPEMFAPDVWPAYYDTAKGCRVWDLDGQEYIDMSIMGIGANILGYADDDVDQAVIQTIKKGNSSSLNCPEEIARKSFLS